MKNIKNIFYAGMLALCTVSLASCGDDDETYDFPGDPYNRAHFKTSELTYRVTGSPVGYFNTIDGKLPIRIQKALEENVTVKVEPDYSLLEDYNAANKTAYLAAPDGLVNIGNTTLTIEAGETISMDSISLTPNESKFSELELGKTYLLPVQITTTSNNEVVASTNMGTLYVVIGTAYSYARDNGGSADMLGSVITDYSAWSYTSSHTTSAISNLWTTSTSSGLAFNSNPSTVVFDMGSNKKISGFRAMSRYSSSGYRFSNIKLSISTDGVTFTEVADQSNSKMAVESSFQYVCLYEGIEAKYLKLEVTFATSYTTMVRLQVYEE